MTIKKIKIQGFKSIYNELILNFEDITGFWRICGDVGTGKTTIGEAIIFGLFGSITGKSNDSLISWGKKHSLIETWCTCKNHSIYIKREINKYGQSPTYVEIDGEELVFNNKRDCQQQLENEYYDISKTTLELLCIISFNNFKSLATLSAGDTKKFLDQVLGLNTLNQYIDVCKQLKKIPQDSYSKILNKISSNNDQIEKIKEIINTSKTEGDIEKTQQNIEQLNKLLSDKTKDLDQRINNVQHEIINQSSQLSKIKTLGANKKKEIDFIKKGICPTCGAAIDQSQLSIKEEERKVLVEQYKTTSNIINSLEKEKDSLINEKTNINSNYKSQILEQHKLLATLKEQEKNSCVNIGVIENIKNNNIKLDLEVSKYKAEEEQWNELQDLLTNNIQSKIISSFIPSLNKNIAKYAQQLHIPYNISFDFNFKCSISVFGVDNSIPTSSLSTGQLKTVDMCIILGMLGTIMSAVSFNIMFLDELLSNMDFDLRTIICKVLRKNLKQDQTLFIISHIDIDDKYFDGDIQARLHYIDDIHRESIYTINKY